MKAILTATRRPMLAGTMTRQELVREAEHAFPYPSPIVQRMIEELRGEMTPLKGNKAMPIIEHVHGEGQCPACGAHLNIDLQG